jgi:hypothetical protein
LGFHEPLYFRYSHPLSLPQGEGVWKRFFINLTMPSGVTVSEDEPQARVAAIVSFVIIMFDSS